MQVQVDIDFDQLIKIVRTLPAAKLRQLKAEIERKSVKEKAKSDLKTILLKGPVAKKNN